MSAASPSSSASTQRSLAASLAPALTETTGGRLDKITWFKADWQRGGAATGLTGFRDDADVPQPAILKLPVVGRELIWMRRLQDDPDPVVPRILAAGDSIGGYDLAWIVMERFPYGPLGLRWHKDHPRRIAEAAARFHAGAARFPIDRVPVPEDWDHLLEDARRNVKTMGIPDPQRWNKAIKKVQDRRDDLAAEWNGRDVSHWLHGDLHLANAMSRSGLESGPVSLIDLAEVHTGHWVEDAVYLERQLWARPERLAASKPVKAMASARRKVGLDVDPGYPRLANIRRVLLAATAPRFIKSEGHPLHLEACLQWVDKGLKDLG